MPLSVAVGTYVGELGWDTDLIVAGFNWNEKSIWIVDDLSTLKTPSLDVLFRTAGILMTSGSIMVACFSEQSQDSDFEPKNLLVNCGYQIKGSTRVGEQKANYGRWVGPPSDICLVSASPRSRKTAPAPSEG